MGNHYVELSSDLDPDYCNVAHESYFTILNYNNPDEVARFLIPILLLQGFGAGAVTLARLQLQFFLNNSCKLCKLCKLVGTGNYITTFDTFLLSRVELTYTVGTINTHIPVRVTC